MSKPPRRSLTSLTLAATCALILGSFAFTTEPASAAPPPNDNFANAQVIGPSVPIAVPATTVDSTAEAGEPPHFSTNPATHTVWYSWTAPVSMTAVVDVCDQDPTIGFNTEAVYTGNSLNSLTPVDSTAGACMLRFAATGGQNYKIAIDHNNEVGPFTFRLRQLTPPANDNFANAETIGPSLPITIDRSNVDSTAEANEPAVNGGGSALSVWFKWTAPANGSARLDMCDFDTRSGAGNHAVSIFTGSSITALTTVFTSSTQCRTTFNALSGTTYRIAFSGTIGGEGTFALKMLQAVPPPNDNFSSPITVGPGLPVALGDDNVFATVEAGEPFHGNLTDTSFPPHDSVSYTWTPAANVQARVSVCDAGFSARLGVYTGNAVNSLTRVTPSVPINSFPFCSIRFNAVMGTSYRIAVGGSTEDTEGTFLLDIHVFAPPANDNFSNAQQLPTALPISVGGSTIDAGAEAGEPNHGEDFGARTSVCYRWTPAVSELVSLDTCASDFDALIGVHTGTALNTLSRVATSEGGPGCGGPFGGRVTLNAVAGTTYFIAVDGFDEGHFALALSSLNPTAPTPGFNLKAAVKKCKKKFPKGKKRKKCIKKAKKRAKRAGLNA